MKGLFVAGGSCSPPCDIGSHWKVNELNPKVVSAGYSAGTGTIEVLCRASQDNPATEYSLGTITGAGSITFNNPCDRMRIRLTACSGCSLVSYLSTSNHAFRVPEFTPTPTP